MFNGSGGSIGPHSAGLTCPETEQLQQVVADADEQPFPVHLRQTPQQELSEAPALLDLAEHRLNCLHPKGVALTSPFRPRSSKDLYLFTRPDVLWLGSWPLPPGPMKIFEVVCQPTMCQRSCWSGLVAWKDSPPAVVGYSLMGKFIPSGSLFRFEFNEHP